MANSGRGWEMKTMSLSADTCQLEFHIGAINSNNKHSALKNLTYTRTLSNLEKLRMMGLG